MFAATSDCSVKNLCNMVLQLEKRQQLLSRNASIQLQCYLILRLLYRSVVVNVILTSNFCFSSYLNCVCGDFVGCVW